MASEDPKFSGVVFINDFLKIDDRAKKNYPNPNKIHGDWLYSLFSTFIRPFIKENAPFDGEDISNGLNRFSFYTDFKLPFDTSGWAFAYHRDEPFSKYLADRLHQFDGKLLIGFELSPLLLNAIERAGLSYIDLGIHSIRFLPDYVFGVRTNVPLFQERISSFIVPYDEIISHVAVSKGRSARVCRNQVIDPGSAIFLGQISIDSSLISNHKMTSQKEILDLICELRASFPQIYYKFHPHCEKREEIEEQLTKNDVKVVDQNIYDIFNNKNVNLFASFSSGSLTEANLFGCNTIRLSEAPSPYVVSFDGVPDHLRSKHYIPIQSTILRMEFWRYLLTGEEFVSSQAVFQSFEPMKFMLNQKWGR